MFSTSLLRLSANLGAEHAQEALAAAPPQNLQPTPQQPHPVYPQQLYYLPYPPDNLALMQYNLLFLQQAQAQRHPGPAPAPAPALRGSEGTQGHFHRHPAQAQGFQPRRGDGGPQQHGKRRNEEEEEEDLGEDKIALTGLLSKSHQSKEEVEKWVRARRQNFPTRENVRRRQQAAERDGEAGKMKESELSILEVKLRKKLTILDYNPHEEKRLHRERKTLLHRINSRKRLLASQPPAEERHPAPDAPQPDRKHRKDKKHDRKPQGPEDPAARPPEEPRRPRAHTPQDIIEHLQARRLEDDCAISSFIRDKPQTDRFKHQQHSLLSHLLLADIYRERSIVLQAVRHLVKQDFLQQPQA